MEERDAAFVAIFMVSSSPIDRCMLVGMSSTGAAAEG